MNFKKITYSISFLCVLIVASCTTRDDEFTPPEGSSPVAYIVTSLVEANNDRELLTRTGFEVEFLDASIGTSEDRNWVFPEGSVDIVSGDLTTQKIKVMFTSAGVVPVTLSKGSLEDSIDITVLEGTSGSFTAAPVDPTVSGFSINPTTREIIVEAGTDVQFTSTVTGGLDLFSWKFPGQDPVVSAEANPIIKFKKLGVSEYNARFRSNVPFGDIRLPNYPTNETELFYKVTVVPSSLPLTINSPIIENMDGEIVITFSRELDATTLDLASSFTLLVDGAPATIQSVRLDPNDASSLLVKPMVDILNTQVATIAYTNTDLISTDGVNAPSFSATNIIVFTQNLFANGIFEGVTTDDYDVNSNFQGAGNRAAIAASFPDGVGVDNSRALVFTVTGAAAGDSRAIFGDKQKDTDESRVQLIEPLENDVTYTVKAMIKFTGVKPTSFEFGVVNFRFIGNSLVFANLDISSVVEGADFVEVEGTFTTRNLAEAGQAYAIPRLTAGTGDSVITVDNIIVIEREE